MNAGLADRILGHAERRPHAPALTSDGVTLSYADLRQAVDAAQARWRARGLSAGDSLGWLGWNRVAMLVDLLACERLGARLAPLNWRLSASELARIGAHANLQQLHVDESVVELGRALQALLALPQPRAVGHEPGDLLLVYTSGSTGEPKGVVHPSSALLANIAAAVDAQSLSERTRVLSTLPLFHVGGLCIQTLPVLAVGGEVVLHARFDADAWLRDVGRLRPTCSLLVPAAMRALVEHPDWDATDLSSLVFVNSGSSVVPPALIERFHARAIPVARVYGATETGPVSVVIRAAEAMASTISGGHPALGVELRLLDEQGVEVAHGAVGEIVLRAPNLMRCYHRQTPAQSLPGGWFSTGDLGREDALGRVAVVGRSKDMIISGGENIYPAEIENLFADDANLAEVAVIGLPDPRWGEVPVLVVVPRDGFAVDSAAIMARLAQNLARYKLPRRIEVIDALPRTALGKVQKPLLVERLHSLDQPDTP